LVGRLIYLSHARPDVAYSIGVVSKFIHDPRKKYMQVVPRILQYLKATPGRGILFKRGEKMTMETYADTDYTGSLTDRRSYYRLLYISWRRHCFMEE